MTSEQIETLARKAHWICASFLSPAIAKDPQPEKYWAAMTGEFKEPWRDIVRQIVAEIENARPQPLIPSHNLEAMKQPCDHEFELVPVDKFGQQTAFPDSYNTQYTGRCRKCGVQLPPPT